MRPALKVLLAGAAICLAALWTGAALAGVTVTLTAPANGTVYAPPATITLEASASANQGYVVTRVDFYQGTMLIGSDTAAPYSTTWSNVAPGSYVLTAQATATKSNGATQTATSSPVSVRVNAPPSVSITSPANGATFTAPATIAITANAADSDGTISRVDFYQGTTLLGSATIAPYSFSWTSVGAGNYALTAQAVDNDNGQTTSAPVTVTVNPAPPALFFIEVDHLNTPRLVADATGTTVWRWDQAEPFGDSPADENPSGAGAFDLPLRLPGQYYDAESGLHQNNNREYAPSDGRYVESDPLGITAGLSTYAYVDGNPLTKIDPLGLQSLAACANPVNAAACAAAGIGSSANTAGSITRAVTTIITGAAAASQTSSTEQKHCDEGDVDCQEHFTRCLGSALADLPGSVYGSSRCGLCRDACVRSGGHWPDIAMTGGRSVRCDYWNYAK